MKLKLWILVAISGFLYIVSLLGVLVFSVLVFNEIMLVNYVCFLMVSVMLCIVVSRKIRKYRKGIKNE